MASDLTLQDFFENVYTRSLPKTPLFGQSIEKHMEEQKKYINFLDEPWVVKKTCDFIRQYGLETEGIFRVPGSQKYVKELVALFDAGQNVNFDSYTQVEDVADLLKRYLRSIPEPLFSDGTDRDLLQAELKAIFADEDAKDIPTKIRSVVMRLPPYRKTLLIDLFDMLQHINANSKKNKMTSENLATILGNMSEFLSTALTPRERMMLVFTLVENYQEVFGNMHLSRVCEFETSIDPSEKKAVKIYFYDGTFRSVFMFGNETAADLKKKAQIKVRQTTDLDTSGYQLYEIWNWLQRELEDDENILNMYGSDNALLFVNRSEYRKKPTINRQLSDELLKRSLSMPSEGYMSVSVGTASKGTQKLSKATSLKKKRRQYKTAPVNQSSKSDAERRARKDSMSELNDSLNKESSEEPVADIDNQQLSADSSTVQFFGCSIYSDCRLEDGFYDISLGDSDKREFNTEQGILEIDPVHLSKEIIVVDANRDPVLRKCLNIARELDSLCSSGIARIECLAIYVSKLMGGGFVQSELRNRYVPIPMRRNIVTKEQTKQNSKERRVNILKIGEAIYGDSRHRAILFKYIADRLEPPIASCLMRSWMGGSNEFYWNIVTKANWDLPRSVYVDLTGSLTGSGRKFCDLEEPFVKLLISTLNGPWDANLVGSVRGAKQEKLEDKTYSDLIDGLEPAPIVITAANDGAEANTSSTVFPDSVVVFREMIFHNDTHQIYRAGWNGMTVVVKKTLTPNGLGDAQQKYLVKTLSAKKELRHENVIPTIEYGIRKEEGYFFVILEYMAQYSLGDWVKARYYQQLPLLNPFCILFYIHHIAKGLEYLHQKNYYHGNLTTLNVLLDGDREPYAFVKLINSELFLSEDWDPANIEDDMLFLLGVDQKDLANSPREAYIPIYQKADIWLLGIVCLELITKSMPEYSIPELCTSIQMPGLLESMVLPTHYALLSLIRMCCAAAPDQRPTSSELVALTRKLMEKENDADSWMSLPPTERTTAYSPPLQRKSA
ncbi:uncharacterized protein LOC126318277 [Schistocerca gregaria]|uniref:uncharacterized protein LOC126318277 n=1 Tax=Schistocerca gregaria TaxID=7010 RepID=UPI00211E7FB5|nr:uncharacterized protein LOC126318277 [Schistocerca gregaria]